MSSFAISDKGWITKIMTEMKDGKPASITVSGNDAFLIIGKISHVMDRLPFGAFPMIPKINIGGESIDPLMLPFFLGSIGSLGAAGACVAYVLGIAHTAGYKVALAYDAKDPFTIMDDQLIFKLTK